MWTIGKPKNVTPYCKIYVSAQNYKKYKTKYVWLIGKQSMYEIKNNNNTITLTICYTVLIWLYLNDHSRNLTTLILSYIYIYIYSTSLNTT